MSQARIIDQETDLELESGDYILVDNLERGTRKYDLGAYSSGIKNQIAKQEKDVNELSKNVLTENVKKAILDCFAHVSWSDANGKTYYDALSSALNNSES